MRKVYNNQKKILTKPKIDKNLPKLISHRSHFMKFCKFCICNVCSGKPLLLVMIIRQNPLVEVMLVQVIF